MPNPLHHLTLLLALLLALTPTAPAAPRPPVERSVQGFLDSLPGPLKHYQDHDGHSAAAWVEAVSSYYSVSPRILLALLEGCAGLLSTPGAPEAALRRPISPAGPQGFGPQLDWAAGALRSALGPYQRAPVLTFTDQTTYTVDLAQAPEGVAVQQLLALGRTQPEWRAAVARFGRAFQDYFDNQLPLLQGARPPARSGFLRRPWPAGTRVTHLAFFDHRYPTVDSRRAGDGDVLDYRGRGGVQYDGHDGHDYVFPDQPVGTHILAAADGLAYARTHRGNGVVIVHPDGYETVYWHLDKFARIFQGKLNSGQGVPVRAGDLIGSSGASGFSRGTPHLHFEVRHNGRQVDPYGWFGPGDDPCVGYRGCEASIWLWDPALRGELDFTPPAKDQRPPR